RLHAMWAIDSQSDGDQIPEEFTFVLERGITIGGKIVDFEENPIAGADVEANLPDDGTDGYSDRADRTQPGIRPVFARSLTDSDREIVTDEQGVWTIHNVPDLEEFFNRNTREPFFVFDDYRDSPVYFSVSHPKYVKFESNIDQNQASELSRKKLIERSSEIYLLPEKKARRNPETPTSKTEKRVADILISLKKLKNSVDDIRASISHIRELVSIGPEAVPLLVEELDETMEDLMIVRLAFMLRAIGDPRAVPGLIRVLPKTLFSYRTGIGLFIDDPELTRFMKRYDLQNKDRENYFAFGSPYLEVMGALQKLTGRDAGRLAMNWVRLSQSPRRADLQRELFRREAKVWETWWMEHGRELTTDEKYYDVDLDQHAEFLPPRIDESTIQPRLKSEFNGMTLSPFNDQTKFRTHFYDIDTGYSPAGPEPLPKNEEEIDYQKLGEWAKENGVDLMCVSHRSPDGTISYELRGFDLTAWDISREEVETMSRSIKDVEFPS
ncbi:MAG: HEAT repeat domain-containing protein, partial [Planctomycetaceae bacterium]|nr:HEAT repeat domain-containing protein [Planctomycetaceae bacterium]